MVKKSEYDTKRSDIDKEINDEDYAKYITTQQQNKLASNSSISRLTQASLPSKTDILDFEKETDFVLTKRISKIQIETI